MHCAHAKLPGSLDLNKDRLKANIDVISSGSLSDLYALRSFYMNKHRGIYQKCEHEGFKLCTMGLMLKAALTRPEVSSEPKTKSEPHIVSTSGIRYGNFTKMKPIISDDDGDDKPTNWVDRKI